MDILNYVKYGLLGLFCILLFYYYSENKNLTLELNTARFNEQLLRIEVSSLKESLLKSNNNIKLLQDTSNVDKNIKEYNNKLSKTKEIYKEEVKSKLDKDNSSESKLLIIEQLLKDFSNE